MLRGGAAIGTSVSGGSAHVPPPVAPMLFAAPDRQQVVAGVRPPEARSDLVDLIRVVNDHIAASMGESDAFRTQNHNLNHWLTLFCVSCRYPQA